MGIQEELAGITEAQLSEMMHAASEATGVGSERGGSFLNYVEDNYPEIYEFIKKASHEMPLETEEQFIYFRLGAAFASAAICRNIDRLALPSL